MTMEVFMLWVIFDYSQINVFVCGLNKRSTLQKEKVTPCETKGRLKSEDLFPMSKMNV